MLWGRNSRAVVDAINPKLDEIRHSLPPGVTLEPYYDRTDLIRKTIGTVERNLLEGGLLVVTVLFLMLGSLRSGLLVATAIPLSMLCAFIGMAQAGISGNLMSLGAIDFGLIVDGSVVLVEAMLRGGAHETGEKRVRAMTDAALEVARPVAFAVGIITVVYLPILTLGGIEGKMFRPMAYTVVFALVGSLLLALTLVPALAAVALGRKPRTEEPFLVRWSKRAYAPVLRSATQHRIIVVCAALVLVAIGAAIGPFLGAEFIPKLDEGAFAIEVTRAAGVSLEQSIRDTTIMEKTLTKKLASPL